MTDIRGGVHRLPDLPYQRDALAPHLSAESFDYRYGKHHAAYVAKLNQLLAGHEWATLALTDLIVAANRTPGARATCDVWEHAYYIDYRNARADFLAAYLDRLVNWEEAARRLDGAQPYCA